MIAGMFEEFGADLVNQIKSDIGTMYPPASEPFESPHKRTGDLQAGVGYLVSPYGETVILEVVSEAPYSASLEAGRSNMLPRPFFFGTVEDWIPRLQDYFDRQQATP